MPSVNYQSFYDSQRSLTLNLSSPQPFAGTEIPDQVQTDNSVSLKVICGSIYGDCNSNVDCLTIDIYSATLTDRET